MAFSAQDIANHIQGKIIGNQGVEVDKINGLEYADSNSLSFLSKQSYTSLLDITNASIIIVNQQSQATPKNSQCFIVVENVASAIQQLSILFKPTIKKEFTINNDASVDTDSSIAETVSIGAFSVVDKGARIAEQSQIGTQVYIGENVRIGKQCIIYSGVKIYANTIIGNNVIIHSNAVIGSDGFGYHFENNQFYKIEDSTIIKEGTKLDNLIQLAHNVEIGKHTVIAAQSGISGSTTIGNHVQLGGQVGIAGHIEIADGTQIQAQSGVPSSINEKNKKWYGYPTLPFRDYLRSYAIFKKLPQIVKELLALRKDVDELKK